MVVVMVVVMVTEFDRCSGVCVCVCLLQYGDLMSWSGLR